MRPRARTLSERMDLDRAVIASRKLPRLFVLLAVAVVLPLMAAAGAYGQTSAQPPVDPRQKELERDAAINLSLAKKSIQEDGFYNARVALNVWKASAIDAGSFDQKSYAEMEKQLYEKSVRDNLRCVEASISQRDATDANLCLRIYRLHSEEINAFDPLRYSELLKRVRDIRKKGK